MGKRKAKTEARCSVCGVAMPECEVYRGRILVCEHKACKMGIRAYGGRSATPKFIEANQIMCSLPGCGNYVPEGFYQPNTRFPVCGKKCDKRRPFETDTLICAYPACGKEFQSREGCHRFHTEECATRHAQDLYIDSHCGRFSPIYREYIDIASLSMRSMSKRRSGLATFMQFINEAGITDLDEVKSTTITQFLKWGESTAKPSVWDAIWVISAFFKWMIFTGRRKLANPVVTTFHQRPKAKRLPRPYTEEEMQYIWALLDLRGTTGVRLAVAIAEESGLRIGELCNLRMSDIDIKRQRLFVRLPNKTMVEAWVPFDAKTVEYLKVWVAERDPKLPHDFLLCSPQGTPFSTGTLHSAMVRILCKTYHGRACNDDGLDKWSTHRLRHTMATRLVAGGANAAAIMGIGRWASFDAMKGYSQVDDAVQSRGYNDAMASARENRKKPQTATSNFRKYVKQSSPTNKAL